MEPISIIYQFRAQGNEPIEIALTLQPITLELVDNRPKEMPAWSRLDFHQCSNCPLTPETHPYCPLAANLVNVVGQFNTLHSFDRLQLDVIIEERRVSQETAAQKALSSLIGLISAASGCPNTAFFKPMARFHLPLSSSEETMYRVISMYLMAQYFRQQGGDDPDMDLSGLSQIYSDVEVVNWHMAQRLAVATETDSSLNAIVILDLYAKTLPLLLEKDLLIDSLEEIRGLFSSFLEQRARSMPPHKPYSSRST